MPCAQAHAKGIMGYIHNEKAAAQDYDAAHLRMYGTNVNVRPQLAPALQLQLSDVPSTSHAAKRHCFGTPIGAHACPPPTACWSA